jgi:hypothetical protein
MHAKNPALNQDIKLQLQKTGLYLPTTKIPRHNDIMAEGGVTLEKAISSIRTAADELPVRIFLFGFFRLMDFGS